MLSQVGLSFDLSPLISWLAIVGISIVCLVLDLVALLATQSETPRVIFAIMAGALTLSTGIICLVWAAILSSAWNPWMFWPILVIVVSALTITAGYYMRRKTRNFQ